MVIRDELLCIALTVLLLFALWLSLTAVDDAAALWEALRDVVLDAVNRVLNAA